MLTIGIDTSTEIGAIGLIDGDELLAEINISLYRRHSERLLPNIEYLFKETERDVRDLEGLAVTVGPGSFTGLRIGLSTIKTFAQCLNIPLIGLSTLDVLAFNAYFLDSWLIPVLDARRNRVYTSLYKGGDRDIKRAKQWEDQALTVNELFAELKKISPDGHFYIFGNGVSSYKKQFTATELNISFLTAGFNKPRGGIVASLGQYYLQKGETDELNKILPNYLKKPQVKSNYQTGGK